MKGRFVFSYEKLDVFIKARGLVKMIYEVTSSFPKTELYGLSDQIRRASVSVPSNIAEGLSRITNKEKARFVEIAYGSLMEVNCQLLIACDLNYCREEDMSEIFTQINDISLMLNSLRNRLMR